MNGAQALIRTLVDAGVDVCFMNPGTSEMHFVAALDDVPEMQGVLALFEGVATGAADGYARIADRPAAVLLHLGPGLGTGLANVSSWVRSSASTAALPGDAAAAVAAAWGPPGQVATLILPADVSWSDGAVPAPAPAPTEATPPDTDEISAIAEALQGDAPAALFVGGRACRADALVDASRVANATGAKLLAETFPARLERGAGRVPVERLAYLAEFAEMQLGGLRHLVLVDAKSPVSFFAYPGRASDLVPEGCTVHVLAGPDGDPAAALAALADAVDAPSDGATLQEATRPELPRGPLTADAVCQAIGALLPEGAIVSDEGNTSGLFAAGHTAGAPPHDWLCLTGGAIGQGLPVALGAAVAAPDRKVIALEADGSAMYTLQALWTMAREQLDVLTVVFNNSSYAVLNMELSRVGATAGGEKAKEMLDLHGPELDFVSLAAGMGVPATRATTSEDFAEQLRAALSQPGPALIDAIVPPIL
jgi:acetolactate synthase-1/2/3 large subunit